MSEWRVEEIGGRSVERDDDCQREQEEFGGRGAGYRADAKVDRTRWAEAAARKAMNWIGAADTAREYILVSDAMEIAARIRGRGRVDPSGCAGYQASVLATIRR